MSSRTLMAGVPRRAIPLLAVLLAVVGLVAYATPARADGPNWVQGPLTNGPAQVYTGPAGIVTFVTVQAPVDADYALVVRTPDGVFLYGDWAPVAADNHLNWGLGYEGSIITSVTVVARVDG